MAIPNEPLTRTEQYLNRTATGGGTIPDEPLTRFEMYLNKIATGSGNTPDKPLTRLEMYLDEIAENGDGGVAQETLLASGSYTQEDVVSVATIPVSYTGTPTKFFVIKDTEDDGVGEVLWWARVNVAEPQFPASVGGQIRTQYYKTSTGGYAFAGGDVLRIPDSSSIEIRQTSANYKINPGTYSWYIWGYAE